MEFRMPKTVFFIFLAYVIYVTAHSAWRFWEPFYGDPPKMETAIENNDLETVRKMLEDHPEYVHLELGIAGSSSPLHRSAYLGNKKMIELLLEHDANVDLRRGRTKCTPLGIAAAHGHIEVVKILLEHGAYINFRDKMGQSPIMDAVSQKRIETVKLLISKGANIHAKDRNGKTVLEYAPKNSEVEKIILQELDRQAWTPHNTAGGTGSGWH